MHFSLLAFQVSGVKLKVWGSGAVGWIVEGVGEEGEWSTLIHFYGNINRVFSRLLFFFYMSSIPGNKNIFIFN